MNPSFRIVCITVAAVALGVLLLNLPIGKEPVVDETGRGAGLQPEGNRASGESLGTQFDADPTSQREAIASEVPLTSGEVGTPPADVSGLTPAVNEATRALRAENLERRRVQIKEQIENRAVRISNALALAADAVPKIVGVFLEEQAKLDAIRAAFTDGDRSRESRDKMRAETENIPVWREQRFTTLFGPEVAHKIINFDDAAAFHDLESQPQQPKD